MKQICKITEVSEEKQVTFKDGTTHRKVTVWVAPAEAESDGRTWATVTTLWDERIDAFRRMQENNPETKNLVMVSFIPSYRKLSNENYVSALVVKITDID